MEMVPRATALADRVGSKGGVAFGRLHLAQRARRLLFRSWCFAVERVLFSVLPAFGTPLRHMFRRRIGKLVPVFDPGFYLVQFLNESRREAASRDPILHYLLIGRHLLFAINPEFDPVFYRADRPDIRVSANAGLHYAEFRARPTNEVAALNVLKSDGRQGCVVTIAHGRGGGSGKLLTLYEAALAERGHRIIRLSRVARQTPYFRAYDRSTGDALGGPFHLFENADEFADLCRAQDVSRLLINHTIDLPFAVFDWWPDWADAHDLPFDAFLHDYFLTCPRVYQVDGSARHCGGPPATVCNVCVSRNGSEAGIADVGRWRNATERFIHRADNVFVPSRDLALRLRRHWPQLSTTVWQPEDETRWRPAAQPKLGSDAPLRIAIIGAINAAKGYWVLLSLARWARRYNLPLHFLLLGSSTDDRLLRAQGVEIYGRYRDDEAAAMIDAMAPHVALLPSIWPETWSFTLSLALRSRLPAYAFDIGAPAERLRNLGRDTVLPLALAYDAPKLAEVFLGVRRRMARPASAPGQAKHAAVRA